MDVWRGRDVNDFFYALWSQEDYISDLNKARKTPHDNGTSDRAGIRGRGDADS
jgi:hypothetical protein